MDNIIEVFKLARRLNGCDDPKKKFVMKYSEYSKYSKMYYEEKKSFVSKE